MPGERRDQPDDPPAPGPAPDPATDIGETTAQRRAAHPPAPGADDGGSTRAAEPALDLEGRENLAPALPGTRPAPPFGARPPMWADPSRTYEPGNLPLEHEGFTRTIETGVLTVGRRVDHLQARIAPIAFAYAVFKKYADDEGSRLAALMAYFTFLSLFPVAIGAVTILSRVLRNSPEKVRSIIQDVVPEAYQQQIFDAYRALPTSGAPLWIAMVGLLLAGTGGAFALYAMTNQLFAVPYRYRYGFGPRYVRVVLVVFIMAIAVLIVSVGGGIAGAWSDILAINRISVFLMSTATFSASLYVSITILSRRVLHPRELLPGALLGGIVVTTVVSLGSRLVTSFVANSAPVYGAFATVIAVISVLVLTSNGIVISLEISIVHAWELWPRGIDIHLLFPGDERAYALLTLMDERMPSQRNDVRFDATGHFHPARPLMQTLNRHQPGVPPTPYDQG